MFEPLAPYADVAFTIGGFILAASLPRTIWQRIKLPWWTLLSFALTLTVWVPFYLSLDLSLGAWGLAAQAAGWWALIWIKLR